VSASPFAAITPIGTALPLDGVSAVVAPLPAAQAAPASFGQVLLDGIGKVDRQIMSADTLATAFATDDSIPVHQVTFALEQARLSLELMLQVRGRLVEGYQQIMGMQL